MQCPIGRCRFPVLPLRWYDCKRFFYVSLRKKEESFFQNKK